MNPLLLGIDIGTTNIKAIVFDVYGQIVSAASVKTPTHYPRPGWAYYAPDEIWRETVGVIRQAVKGVAEPRAIVGTSVASVGEAAVPVDANGEATYDSIAWFDTRTQAQALWLDEHIGHERLFRVSGLSLQPIFGLCKLLWLREHEPVAFQRTVRWLNMADYIAFRLSGEQVTEYSLASRTLMLNLRKLQWDEDLCRDLNLPLSIWGPLTGSGVKIGTILPEVAAATGLPIACVVATGGQDHMVGALPLGVNEPGILLDSLGSAEAMFLPIAQPLDDPQVGAQGYGLGVHAAGGYYLLGGMYTSGVCMEWFRDTFAPGTDYGNLIAEGEPVPPGSLGVAFLPHLRLAHPPHSDALSRGCFIGLNTSVTRGVLYRALLEGIAFDYRNGINPLLSHAGRTQFTKIVATGGGTRNHLLMQIKASVLNQTLHVVSIDEATALGAAVLGGIGAEVYPSVVAAVAQLRYDVTPVHPLPDQVALYDAIFSQVFQEIYPTVRTLHHAVAGLQQLSVSNT